MVIFKGIAMDTIYNFLYQNEPIEKGVIEIFQTYDGSYYDIALDGKFVEDIYKRDYIPTLLSRKFIKQCCKASGKTEDKLVFVMYDFFWFGEDHVTDFDTNDYNSYKSQIDLVKQYVTNTKEIDNFKSKYLNYRYFGIEHAEEQLT
jgi:hypothetical protein